MMAESGARDLTWARLLRRPLDRLASLTLEQGLGPRDPFRLFRGEIPFLPRVRGKIIEFGSAVPRRGLAGSTRRLA